MLGELDLPNGPPNSPSQGISGVQLSHRSASISARFDDPTLVSSAVLVPVAAYSHSAGLRELADQHLGVPTDKGANRLGRGGCRAIAWSTDQGRRKLTRRNSTGEL